MTKTRNGPTEIVVRMSSEAQVTLANLSARPSRRNIRIGRGGRSEVATGRARPILAPNLPKEDPKTANAKPDQPPVAAEIPSEPPQSL
jgi:hypothetical protein